LDAAIVAVAAAGSAEPPMSVLDAALLGLVEGVTEYLPVSSTGHLILVQRLLGIEQSEAADAFAIAIQGGAILAVLYALWPRTKSLCAGLVGRDAAGRALLATLIVGFLPAALIGFAAHAWIERHLFGLWPVVAAWFVGGVGLLALVRWRRRGGASGIGSAASPAGSATRDSGSAARGLELEQLGLAAAFVIGLCQCAALWPGISRSLATLAGGLLVGLSLSAAVEYSFLLGVLTLGAASGYAALKSGRLMLQTYGALEIGVGLGVAFVAAFVSVRFLLAFVRTRDLAPFGWYRIALAAAVATWLLAASGAAP
jgi:undecaprenyl-diphosphatase